MAHEDKGENFIKSVGVTDVKCFANYMSELGIWSAGQSAKVQAKKTLENLVGLGKLDKGNGFYRIPGCKSEWKEHAQLVTRIITDILVRYPDSIVFREHSIEEVGLRPDAIVLIVDGDRGGISIVEAVLNEAQSYLEMKSNTWNQWDKALEYLSDLFCCSVKSYHFFPVRSGENICDRF